MAPRIPPGPAHQAPAPPAPPLPYAGGRVPALARVRPPAAAARPRLRPQGASRAALGRQPRAPRAARLPLARAASTAGRAPGIWANRPGLSLSPTRLRAPTPDLETADSDRRGLARRGARAAACCPSRGGRPAARAPPPSRVHNAAGASNPPRPLEPSALRRCSGAAASAAARWGTHARQACHQRVAPASLNFTNQPCTTRSNSTCLRAARQRGAGWRVARRCSRRCCAPAPPLRAASLVVRPPVHQVACVLSQPAPPTPGAAFASRTSCPACLPAMPAQGLWAPPAHDLRPPPMRSRGVPIRRTARPRRPRATRAPTPLPPRRPELAGPPAGLAGGGRAAGLDSIQMHMLLAGKLTGSKNGRRGSAPARPACVWAGRACMIICTAPRGKSPPRRKQGKQGCGSGRARRARGDRRTGESNMVDRAGRRAEPQFPLQ
jgi:hypothetical protein